MQSGGGDSAVNAANGGHKPSGMPVLRPVPSFTSAKSEKPLTIRYKRRRQ